MNNGNANTAARFAARPPGMPTAAPIAARFSVFDAPPAARPREAPPSSLAVMFRDPMRRSTSPPSRHIVTPPRPETSRAPVQPSAAQAPQPQVARHDQPADPFALGRHRAVSWRDDDDTASSVPDPFATFEFPEPPTNNDSCKQVRLAADDTDDAFPTPPRPPLLLEDPLLTHVRRHAPQIAETDDAPNARPGDELQRLASMDDDWMDPDGQERCVLPPRGKYHVVPSAPSYLSPEFAIRGRMADGSFPPAAPIAAPFEALETSASSPYRALRGLPNATVSSIPGHQGWYVRPAASAPARVPLVKSEPLTKRHEGHTTMSEHSGHRQRINVAASTSFAFADSERSGVEIVGSARCARYRSAQLPTYKAGVL
jgi:hypothetical protein